MSLRFFRRALFVGITLFLTTNLFAQLNTAFDRIFNEILVNRLKLSPGVHGQHFLEAADQATHLLSPALNSLIANNISTFPISSATVASLTFDIASGRPVSRTESLGPILAETAETLGKGKLNVGFNYTYLNLAKFRGQSTGDLRFTFTHQDVTRDGTLGESPNESDTIDIFPNLDVDASVLAFVATLGITNNLDAGIAVPFINVDLSGKARAVANSFTFKNLGQGNHQFGSDPANPVLEAFLPYRERATGLGDVALRFKYNLLRTWETDLAALVEIRLPTGNEKDFLGAGKTNMKFSSIMSKRIGNFTPHLNFSFDRRTANFDNDEFEYALGFDQKIASGVNVAVELSGDYDVNNREVIELFPGSVKIVDQLQTGSQDRHVDLSNIPERNNDNAINAAFGFRAAVSERFLFLGNLLVPLNNGGLRATAVPTIGLTAGF